MTMRIAAIIVACTAAAAGSFAGLAWAAPPPDAKPTSTSNPYSSTLSSSDMVKIQDVSDADRAKAKEESAKLIGALDLPCEPTIAAQVGRGKITADGKVVAVIAYEVACGNGMGYILVSQGSQKPIATSCFAADATRAASIAHGDKPNIYCQLEANKDVKVSAASLLTAAGTACTVSGFRWFGISASSQNEYSEVACADGKGYLLKTPQIGASATVSVLSCQDAAKQGLKCRLTDAGPVSAPVTAQTFRDALKRNGVSCEPTQMRTIGRESVDKRYVVEVQCPEQPKGLVAFIPLEGNTSQFESIDCAAAVERDIVCKFTPK
jgi:hypothetical protein